MTARQASPVPPEVLAAITGMTVEQVMAHEWRCTVRRCDFHHNSIEVVCKHIVEGHRGPTRTELVRRAIKERWPDLKLPRGAQMRLAEEFDVEHTVVTAVVARLGGGGGKKFVTACGWCGKITYTPMHRMRSKVGKETHHAGQFCSNKCFGKWVVRNYANGKLTDTPVGPPQE